MTTRSAACSLAITGAASPGTGSPASSPLSTPSAHYRTSCRSAAPTGAGFGSVPVPSFPIHLPSPDKANFPLSRSLPCCALPWRRCSLGSFFCRSPLLCCSWLPCVGSWEHSLALKGPSPISIQTSPIG